MEANANTPSLLSVMGEYSKLVVDDYQRTYAWEAEQLDEFFEDLIECAQTGDSHFFGTLILQSNKAKEASVVDGQQRLTTSYITVAAIRDAALSLPSDWIEKEDELSIRVSDEAWKFLIPGTKKKEARFTSNKFLRDILMNSVLAVSPDQKAIPDKDIQLTLRFRKAIKYIRGLIREDLEKIETFDEKRDRLYSLLEALTKRFLVLRVTTSTLDESLEIFLTLNNRGLPLGPSDLVRGEITSTLSSGMEPAAQQKLHGTIFDEWRAIAEAVEEPEVFLRHYLVATGDSKVTKKKVVETVSKSIKTANGEKSKALAEEFWANLKVGAQSYSQIINASHDTEMGYYIHILESFARSHRIFSLGLFNTNVSDSEKLEMVRLLNVLCIRYTMASQNAQKLEDYFQSLCKDFRKGAPASEVISKLKEKIDEIPLDVVKYFEIAGENIGMSRAIVHGLSRKLAPGAVKLPLNKGIHLEHIAPQTETTEWLEDLFAGNAALYEDYDKYVKQAGNLTILDPTINVGIGQDSFSEKKKEYKKSVFFITNNLCELDAWRQEHIEARTKWIAECFNMIWATEKPSAAVKDFVSWFKRQI